MYLITNNVIIMFMVNRQTFSAMSFYMSFCITTCQSEQKCTPEIVVSFLVFFTFYINFFMKALIKNIIQVCQTVSLNHLFMHFAKMVCQASLPLFLSQSGNILFRKIPNGNYLFSSASLLFVGKITHWCINFE